MRSYTRRAPFGVERGDDMESHTLYPSGVDEDGDPVFIEVRVTFTVIYQGHIATRDEPAEGPGLRLSAIEMLTDKGWEEASDEIRQWVWDREGDLQEIAVPA